NLARLEQGVEITDGGLANVVTIDLLPDGVAVSQNLKLDASGTRNGQPIRLEPITLDTAANLALANGLDVGVQDVRQFTLALVSSFARIDGSGVPTKATIKGNADLGKLRTEIAQFVDLGAIALSGTADFALNTEGDPTDA